LTETHETVNDKVETLNKNLFDHCEQS